jgi:hypothetical protein
VERASIDVMERLWILLLDDVLESADEFIVRDFDRKDLASVIAMNATVEFEDRMIYRH